MEEFIQQVVSKFGISEGQAEEATGGVRTVLDPHHDVVKHMVGQACYGAPLLPSEYAFESFDEYAGDNVAQIVENLIAELPLQHCKQVHAVSVLGADFDREFAEQVGREAGISVAYYNSQPDAFGIRLAYANPKTYGADRYAALVAAHNSGDGAKIIVDCGTAVTIDAIESNGTHLGGLIIPGIELMCSVLSENTTGIPVVDFGDAAEFLNNNTHDAVVSGSTLCLQQGLRSIIAKIEQQLASSASIYITGGARRVLAEFSHNRLFERPDLVLEGLHIIQSN